MKIQTITDTNFKGYDARTLKGFLMSSNCHGIASEMNAIGQKEGFKIFTIRGGKFREGLPKYSDNTINLWAQDYWTVLKKKILSLEYDKKFYAIKNAFNLKFDFTEKICHETDKIRELNQNLWDIFDEMGFASVNGRSKGEITRDFESKKMELLSRQKEAHVPGGNIFIVKNDKVDEIIIGANELEKFAPEELLSMFSCNRMTILPQMDYHLDLFIRPLDKKRILVADDMKTLEVLESGLQKFDDFLATQPFSERVKYFEAHDTFVRKIATFKEMVGKNKKPNSEMVCSDLRKAGFKPILVPARFYDVTAEQAEEQSLQHICNYINANVCKNKKNELVYITNKSNIDSMLGLTDEISQKIGFSFEKSFINSISKYVKPNKIYFIKGDNNFVANEMLTIYQGGIHCACTEIPRGLKVNKNAK